MIIEMNRMKKIPRLGQKVYLVFRNAVFLDKVCMKRKESFACDSAFDSIAIEEVRTPLFYGEYRETQFTSLSELRKAVVEPKNKLVKISDDYWEIEGKENT